VSQIERLSDFSVSVVHADLLRLVGYKTEREPDDKLRALIAEVTTEAEQLATPLATLGLFEEKDVPAGTHLSSFFGASPEVALSICTIGPHLEERVSGYSSEGELTRALILDAAGSVLAEAVCDYANEKVCAEAVRRSLHATCRVSPGYGMWKIEEQKVVFDLLPADTVGVTLTKSFMMIPRKSVSFAVRLTRERPIGQPSSPCALCGRKDCGFRR